MELNEPFFAEQKRKNGAAGKKFLRYSLDGAVSNPVPKGTAYSRGSTTVLSPIFPPPRNPNLYYYFFFSPKNFRIRFLNLILSTKLIPWLCSSGSSNFSIFFKKKKTQQKKKQNVEVSTSLEKRHYNESLCGYMGSVVSLLKKKKFLYHA